MNVTDLIPFVRTIINEASTEKDAFSEEVDAALRDFLRVAMRQIASMPAYMGKPVSMSESSAVSWEQRPDGMYVATIKCGNDFLRPVSVQLADWVRPVFRFMPAETGLFLSQYSSALGIGNGPKSPVAFLVKDPDTRIIAHSSQEQGTYTLRYIPIPEIGPDGALDIPDVYRDVLAFTTAGLYQQSINEYDAAKASFDTAASLLQLINNESQE